jgi:hypothetical protein
LSGRRHSRCACCTSGAGSADFFTALPDPKAVLALVVSSVLIALNWGILVSGSRAASLNEPGLLHQSAGQLPARGSCPQGEIDRTAEGSHGACASWCCQPDVVTGFPSRGCRWC